MSHKARKFAGLIASIAVGVSLLGAGTYASFTDSATATDNIAVGTFGVAISAAPANAVLAPQGCTLAALNCKSVTLDSGLIKSSAAGSALLPFTVKNVGQADATVSIAQTAASGLTGHFSDALTPVAPKLLHQGDTQDYSGGIAWSVLDSGDLSSNHSVTYTVSATG